MTVWMTLGLILLLVFGFSALRKVAQACSLPANFSPPTSVEPSTFRLVTSSWYAPTAVMVVFVTLSGVPFREFARFYATTPPASAINHSVESQKPPALTTKVNPNRESDSDNEADDDSANLAAQEPPGWIHAGDQTTGDVRQVVLASKLWSTATEATAELQPVAAALVRADFKERHKNYFDTSSHRVLTDEQILHSAVKKRYLESINQDFGAFSAPMYRLWLQVEISPVVRTELYPAWKSGAISNRIVALGTFVAILTLTANAVALFARLIRRSPHRWTRAATIAATSSAAWIAADLLLVARLNS